MTRARVAGLVTAAVGLVGAVGALHLPRVQARLGGLGRAVCPVTPLDPASREEARRRAVVGLRGEGAAPGRPALGFSLGVTTEGEVRAWASRERVACEDARGGSTVTCVEVPARSRSAARAGSGAARVSFRFDPAGRLAAVVAVEDSLTPGDAVASVERTGAALERALGRPAAVTGTLAPAWVAGGDLRQARLEHRFADYYAAVAATRVGRAGAAVTEEYQLLATPPGG
ncbi:MAG: hypothetical protein IT374_23925 [Polyangiaceae bacterium]|nr:hypothetical protein [Polyangiaceae bacterium]